ncbi:MAG: hypothetical protein Q9M30_09870 [Mariprofundaceae bacterium]|nr:hypothetical protein [Mariprofundaceae bacterium]
MAASLVACSVHVPYPLGIKGKPDLSIALSQTLLSAPVSSLSDISSEKPGSEANDRARIGNQLELVRQHVDSFTLDWLINSQQVHVVPRSDAVAVGGSDLLWAGRHGADMMLAVDVAGYGRVKRKWILLMAGSGLIEGVAQGVATAGVSGNPLLGAGVAAEEIASESLTWIGGGWLWNKYLAPVTLEGRMWRVHDGRLVWQDIQFADSSDFLALLFGGKTVTKEDALKASLKEAEDDLFEDLDRYLSKQILFIRKGRS